MPLLRTAGSDRHSDVGLRHANGTTYSHRRQFRVPSSGPVIRQRWCAASATGARTLKNHGENIETRGTRNHLPLLLSFLYLRLPAGVRDCVEDLKLPLRQPLVNELVVRVRFKILVAFIDVPVRSADQTSVPLRTCRPRRVERTSQDFVQVPGTRGSV